MSKDLKKQTTRNRFQRVQTLRIQALLEGAHRNGISGLIQTTYVMMDPNQPSMVGCLSQAEVDFAGASSAEDVWDAALDMSQCLFEAKLEIVPDPEGPDERGLVPGKAATAGNFVLAALLVLLHDQMKMNRPTQPSGQGREVGPLRSPNGYFKEST
jgi:hypothetical protein